MTRLRVLTIISLLIVPLLFLMGMGAYHLWSTNWIFWAWWPLAGCLALAYFLGWQWQKQHHKSSLKAEIPIHSTDRDIMAWRIVEKFAEVTPTKAQLENGDFYFQQARALCGQIALIYYPTSSKPFGCVTLPELLTAIELAMAELREKLEEYLPGSHLLSINNLQHTSTARAWVPRVQNAMWVGSAIMDPVRTGLRFFANRYGVITPLDRFQDNLIAWFYSMFVQRVGYYLIELYSGRLKVGTQQYRKVMNEPAGEVPIPNAAVIGPPLQITFLGSADSVKTDLVRIITGHESIEKPVKEPLTHRLELHDVPDELRIVDAMPYAEVKAKNLRSLETLIDKSDLVIWVMSAKETSAADKAVFAHFRSYFAKHPNRKVPPVILALTGVDELDPKEEWEPPYEWNAPQRPKEHAISNVIHRLREEFASPFVSVVPVSVTKDRIWGIEEFLDPLIILNLNEARAVARLRLLEDKGREGRYGKVVEQVFSGGKQVLGGLLGRMRKQ